ncbi:MAG: hypothetical protein EOP56_15045 [Sphingobacteriales bacterium]|nr:MAG: hypothetical protein EOP56_15045 [Sphingobacteriales bacterium]
MIQFKRADNSVTITSNNAVALQDLNRACENNGFSIDYSIAELPILLDDKERKVFHLSTLYLQETGKKLFIHRLGAIEALNNKQRFKARKSELMHYSDFKRD